MLTKNQVTLTTPNTLLIGVAHNGQRTAVTAAIRLMNGDTEPDVIETVDDNLWQTTDAVLAEARIIKPAQVMILTTCAELYGFLQRPIHVEQAETKKVWVGRDVFTVRTGGNEYQWSILRHLFRYVWRCESVSTLRKAEELLNG